MLALHVTGIEQATARVRDMPRQVRFATARALNDVAFEARQGLQNWMLDHFTGKGGEIPTEWLLRSITVGPATPARLEATVYPRYLGGKSVDPSNVLQAEVAGGMRKTKRAEIALRRIGVLPNDMVTVPGKAAPLDVSGNIPGPYWIKLLAYLQAFGEQGYRANMKARGIARVAARYTTDRGFKAIGGVEFFVSHGDRRSLGQGGRQHLAAGIWSRSGIHGSDVKPIVMFVRAPRYTARFPIRKVVETTVLERMPARFALRIGEALATAR